MTTHAQRPTTDRWGVASAAAAAIMLLVGAALCDALRAAVLLLVWAWPLGILLLRLLRDGSGRSRPAEWAEALAVGLAAAILTCLVLAGLRIRLNAWSVTITVAVELVGAGLLLWWLRGTDPMPQQGSGRRQTTRTAGKHLRSWGPIAAGLASLVLIVGAAAHGLATTRTSAPSTSIFLEPAAGPSSAAGAAASARALVVHVERAAGDSTAYLVTATMTGRAPWTVTAVPPGTMSMSVPIRIDVPIQTCRYALQVGLTATDEIANRLAITVYGGPADAADCTSVKAP